MIDTLSLSPTAKGIGLICVVLLESMVLHVSYGAVTSALGPSVMRALGGE